MTAGIPFFIDILAGRGRRVKHVQPNKSTEEDLVVESIDTSSGQNIELIPSMDEAERNENVVIDSLKPKPNHSKEIFGNAVRTDV
jgi:hypothetical protein